MSLERILGVICTHPYNMSMNLCMCRVYVQCLYFIYIFCYSLFSFSKIFRIFLILFNIITTTIPISKYIYNEHSYCRHDNSTFTIAAH